MDDRKMFCFQCEQTAGGTGCTGAAGVCGKRAETARLQDMLTGELISLGRTARGCGPSANTDKVMLEGLFATVTNVNFSDDYIKALIRRVCEEKAKYGCGPCGNAYPSFDMAGIWDAEPDIKSLKSLILFGLRGMAAYAHHAMVLGYRDRELTRFFYKALGKLAEEEEIKYLLPLALEIGEKNLKCMELLERANCETYGKQQPTEVAFKVERGPFIVITGHDLKDLEMLLAQTRDKGINIYTNGEMLPAHAYPKLKQYAHLKGNFGTAWHNQQKEFDGIPAPILYTTNCLMVPRQSYAKNVFTTGAVAYPGAVHIDAADDGVKDFTPVIECALALGGYSEDKDFCGINGGIKTTVGFGKDTILANAGHVVELVKSGRIKHFFLVAGCDGFKPTRSYYTDFVKHTPDDTVVLTLACGKYRFNDLDLGSIDGIPRLLDMGQCNDAYGAIQVALALADAFGCTVNDLPLSLVLSWYEQKAVVILLTLLHLGIKNILLGPSLPAFISPNVLKILVENYNIAPISTPQDDLKKILG